MCPTQGKMFLPVLPYLFVTEYIVLRLLLCGRLLILMNSSMPALLTELDIFVFYFLLVDPLRKSRSNHHYNYVHVRTAELH